MIAPLSIISAAREYCPLENVTVVTEQAVDKRIKDVAFSAVNYSLWLSEIGLIDGSHVPLQFRIRDRAVADENCGDDGIVTNGSFENRGKSHVINLYVRHLLDWFDKSAPQLGSKACEGRVNHLLNRTAVHELDHHVNSLTEGPIATVEDTFITEGLVALAKEWSINPRGDDETRTNEIADVMRRARSDITHQEYLDQPHEIRARAVSKIFDKNPRPIITISLNKV